MNTNRKFDGMTLGQMLLVAFAKGNSFPELNKPAVLQEPIEETGLVVEAEFTKRLYTIGDCARATANQITLDHNIRHEQPGEIDVADCMRADRDSSHLYRMSAAVMGVVGSALWQEYPTLIGNRVCIAGNWEICKLRTEKWVAKKISVACDHVSMSLIKELEKIFTAETLPDLENGGLELKADDVSLGTVKDIRTRAVLHLLTKLFNEANSFPQDSDEYKFIRQMHQALSSLAWALVEDEVPYTGEELDRRVCKGWEVVALPPAIQCDVRVVFVDLSGGSSTFEVWRDFGRRNPQP